LTGDSAGVKVTGVERHPVLVVGAGPVGMAAALALRHHDLPVRVLEAAAEGRQRPGSRAIFLHRESLEHLESVSPGLGWELAGHGLVWTTKRTYWGEHLVYERTYPPPPPHRLPHATNLSQVEIEGMLFDACKAAGVDFAWEQDVTAVAASGEGVTLRTAAGDEWQAAYVIGADGARSAVRSGVGLELEGPRLDRAFVIVDVADDPEHPMVPERVYYYAHPAVGGRNVLLVPFAGGIRADLQLRPDDDPARFDDPEGVARWIARVLPARYADRVTWVSTYRFRQVVASAFADATRRALLVGEAAHLFAPFGARGLNSGVPDALVAARAVRLALDDPAGASAAVDHFAATRRAAALYNRDAAGLALRHMSANGWPVRWRRRLAAAVARRGLAQGAWLDSSPFGPRAAEFRTETGSY
jgi:3-(3-hydroxy-phenyl)propionate hydroxylase